MKGGRAGKNQPARPPRPAKEEVRAAANRRVAEQNRKLLGKHYAAKYGKRRGT